MHLELKKLSDIAPADLIALMNHPSVRRHLPLARGEFGPAECATFVSGKEALWHERGYGPWAFVIDGTFAGWGGLQPEGDDADLALVLHPRFWGHGKTVFDNVVARAFSELGLTSLTILLPPSRGRAHAIRRLGLAPDGETEILGQHFLRYRLSSPDACRPAPLAPAVSPIPIRATKPKHPAARPTTSTSALATASEQPKKRSRPRG